jgi:hypothetical protein
VPLLTRRGAVGRGRSLVGVSTRRQIVAAVVVGTVSVCGVTAFSAAGKSASNKVAAQRDAQRLLRQLLLPAGAIRLAMEPTGDGRVLRVPSAQPGVIGLVDRHRFWKVPSSLVSVIAFITAHPPHGSQLSSAGGGLEGPGIPPNQSLTFSFAPTDSVAARWLNVDAVTLPDGQTGVRADAQVPTVHSHERVPRDIGVLRISREDPRDPTITVTNRKKISAVAHAVDQYPLGIDAVCSEGVVPPSITFSFLRSRNGPVLARVSGVSNGVPDAGCEPSTLWVRGRGTQLLVEDSDLLHKVNHILRTSLN